MAARDRYSRKLECLKCGHSGFAEVSESDEKHKSDRGSSVDEMPAGFRTERTSPDPHQYMIRCKCGGVFRFLGKTVYAPGGEPSAR